MKRMIVAPVIKMRMGRWCLAFQVHRTLVAISVLAATSWAACYAADDDIRNIETGNRIPDEGYCDMPYVAVTRQGNWICTLTTGSGKEGESGQHVVSTLSNDHGKTWSPLVDIEPNMGPKASWAMPLVTPTGRVYAFYNYNGDNVTTLNGKNIRRRDHLGWYCYRYSDDEGRTWSDRYRLPMRITACDRVNDWGGDVQLFWGVGKPFCVGSDVYFTFSKVRDYVLWNGEGWLYHSDNVLTEQDATKIRWELLPEGDHGIRAEPFDPVQQEHNVVPLAGKGLYCVYRTAAGFPCHSYSRDGGRTWTTPEPMTYTPGGSRIKNPVACPRVWRTGNGKYLFWFHNHGGMDFYHRNPVWLCGGVEKDGEIHWSQPEIVLYHPDPEVRISYPDLVEQDGRYWITETQKTVARVHEIDDEFLERLWNQDQTKSVAEQGPLLETTAREAKLAGVMDLRETGGLSVEAWISLDYPYHPFTSLPIVDTRDEGGRGFVLTIAPHNTLRLELSDGQTEASWETDPGLLKVGVRQHVVAIVDAGPRIIRFVVDGRLCDGGDARQFGWARYEKSLTEISGSGMVRVAPPVNKVRIYGRPLRTSEAVGNFHAGP